MSNNKGFTLLALVITIIIMLILAAISVTALTGDNGLLQNAGRAKENAEIQNEKDIIDKAVYQAMNNNRYGELDATELKTELETNFGESIESVSIKSNNNLQVTFKSGSKYDVDTDGNVTKKEPTVIKVGDTDLSTVTDISTMYGQTTNYKSTSHPNIDWQLFYADSSNYYLIASDYVPNAELPCNGSTVNGVTYTETDLVKSTSTEAQYATYCAKFASSISYNDGVLTAGTIYKNGAASTAITSNSLTNTYLKWATIDSNKTSTNNNICSVAYMIDTNKWSSFADGVSEAYAIGGPTIEMLSLSWNAVSGHTQMTDYTTLSTSNSNTTGYIVQSPEIAGNFFGTSTNMWVIKGQTKANGYWLASPSSNDTRHVKIMVHSGYVNSSLVRGSDIGFRPLVSIPKS